MLDQKWINAHCCNRRHIWIVTWMTRFLTERTNFAGSVFSLERGEIHHRDCGGKTPNLRFLLYAPRCELGHTLFDSDLVDRAGFLEQTLERRARRGCA